MPTKKRADQAINGNRRAIRCHFSAEDKILIELQGLRAEASLGAGNGPRPTGFGSDAVSLPSERVETTNGWVRRARKKGVVNEWAFEAKPRGPICETGGGDMIAEDILRPVQLGRLRRDFQLGFEHLLVVVVARTQHHAVLAKRDRLLIVIGCDVPDGENRHCGTPQ